MNINLTAKEIQLIKKALINRKLGKAEEETRANILEKFVINQNINKNDNKRN